MGRAQAQALAQQTEFINAKASLHLVQRLIRVSVYHVCWLRGLFPPSSFEGHNLRQLDDLHIKMLQPNEDEPSYEEAQTLKNWVEEGVITAVADGYLKSMYFGISEDAGGTQLLEEYIYSFKYGPKGEVEFEVAAEAHKKGGSKKKTFNSGGGGAGSGRTPDDVKYQVVRLMRMLVQLCHTLDEVPGERFLFIKLTYHDHTPANYEPPHFHAVTEDGIGHFPRRPFAMDAGSVDTHHHTLSVRVKSVLESCDDGCDEDGCEEEEGAADAAHGGDADARQQQQQRRRACSPEAAADNGDAVAASAGGGGSPSACTADNGGVPELSPPAAAAAGGRLARVNSQDALAALVGGGASPINMMAPPEIEPMAMDDAAAAAGAGGGAAGGGGGSTSSLDGPDSQAVYEAVRGRCLSWDVVSFSNTLAHFWQLDAAQLDRVFGGLVLEGLLQPTGDADVFNVAQQQQQPGGSAPAAGAAASSGGVMAEAASPLGSSAPRTRHTAAADEQQMLSNRMSGLSVGAAAAAAVARPGRAHEAGGGNASVLAAAVHAGSLQTGQPRAMAAAGVAAPTAAGPQMRGAAALGGGDEPSVQQDGQPAGLWMEHSQQSLHPGRAAAAGGVGGGALQAGSMQAGGGGAGAAPPAARGSSRLRKASFVDSPIHQHAGKRARTTSGQPLLPAIREEDEDMADEEQQPAARLAPPPPPPAAAGGKKGKATKAAQRQAGGGMPSKRSGRLAAMQSAC